MTVRDFQNLMFESLGENFLRRVNKPNDPALELWDRLNRLGNRGYPKDWTAAVPADIDAAVELTPDELAGLRVELDRVIATR